MADMPWVTYEKPEEKKPSRLGGILVFLALAASGLFGVGFMLTDTYLTVFAVSPPNILPYQGRLMNANGVPVADATANMQFRLYDSLAAGTCLWSNDSSSCATDDDQVVTLTDGLFSENLGDTGVGYAAILDSVFADDASVFLEVEVNGEVLTPRKQMGATAYAFNADTLDGMDSASFALESEACMLVGGDGNPGCLMGDAGIVFSNTTAIDIRDDVGGFALPTLTLGFSQFNQGLWVGGDNSQLVFFPEAGTVYPIQVTRAFGTDDVFTLEVAPADYGWTLYGPRVGAEQDWASIAAYQDPVDTQKGTVWIGSNNPRSAASLVPVACAGDDIDGGAGQPRQHVCFMADSSIDLGLSAAGTDGTLSQGGFDRTSGSTETFAFTNGGAGVLDVTVDGGLTVDTNTLFVDDSTNEVGIGTVTPTASFQIDTAGSGSFGGFPALAAITTPDDEWGLVFQNETVGLGSLYGFFINSAGSFNLSDENSFILMEWSDTQVLSQSLIAVSKAEDTAHFTLNDSTNVDSASIFIGDGTAGLDGALSAQAGSLFLDTDGKLWVNIDGTTDWQDLTAGGGGGANTALSNLASVAINTHLIPDSNDDTNLGSDALRWADLFLGPGTLNIGTSDADDYEISYDTAGNALTFNEDGENFDVRIEGDTYTSLLFVDASTDAVGLGTSAPAALLSIEDATNDVEAMRIGAPGSSGSVVGSTYLGFSAHGAGSGSFPHAWIGVTELDVADFRGHLVFSTRTSDSDIAPVEKMRIQADGFVGINDTSPDAHLDVEGSAIFNDASGDFDFRIESDNNDGAFFVDASTDDVFINTDGDATTDFIVQGDTHNSLLFADASADKVGVGTSTPVAMLSVEAMTNDVEAMRVGNLLGGGGGVIGITHLGISPHGAGAGAFPPTWISSIEDGAGTFAGELSFSTRPTSDDIAPTERMRIDNNGNVGISDTTPDAKLDVEGSALFNEGLGNFDFRVGTDTNANGIFLDADAETIDLVGGSGSTGCSVDASGNLTCSGTVAGGGSGFWTLDGTGQTVTADKDMTLSGGVNGFSFDGTTFSVDASNNRIGIGTAAPSAKLHVLDNVDGSGSIQIRNDSNGAQAFAAISAVNDGGTVGANVFAFSSGNTNTSFGATQANATAWFSSAAATRMLIASQGTTAPIEIGTASDTNSNRSLVIGANGTAVVVNEDSSSTIDFRAETDGNANGIFLDASAETIDLVGGSGSTGCSVDASGNLTCSGTVAGGGSGFWTLDGTGQTVTADKDMTLSGGVNGFSFDGSTFSVDATNNRIGIGTAAPNNTLDAYTNANATTYQLGLNNVDTTASALATAGIRFDLADTSANEINAGYIDIGKEQTWTSTAGTQDSFMVFGTTLNGAGLERLRITSAGSVAIGGDTTPDAMLSVGSTSQFQVNSSGRVLVDVGATGAGNLAYSFVGDTDTGLYRSAADEIRFQTAAADRMILDAGGDFRVGSSAVDTTVDRTLEIAAVAGDDADFAMIDDDVAHGITGFLQTNMFLQIDTISATAGGADITVASDADAQPFVLRSLFGSTDPTDTTPAIELLAGRNNGAASFTALADAETVLKVNNNATETLAVLGSGTVRLAGGSGSTGCTVDGATGNLTCAGTVSGGGSSFANTALSNLASVAINTDLIPDSNDDTNLGSDALRWADLFLGPGTLHIGTADADDYEISYNTTDDALVFNEDGDSFDVRMESDTNANLFFVDASADRIGIGTNGPQALFDIAAPGSGTAMRIFDSVGGVGTTYTRNTITSIGTGLTLDGDTTSGDAVRIRTDGVTRLSFDGTTGYAIFGNSDSFAGTELLTAVKSDNTAGVLDILRLVRDDADGVGTNGLGIAIDFAIETSSAGNHQSAAEIVSQWEDATNASLDGSLIFNTKVAGAMTEAMRIDDLGFVGIGAMSPDAKLDIESTEDTERIRLTDTSNTDSAGIYVGDGTAGLDGTLSAQAGSIFLDVDGKLWVNIDGTTDWTDLTAAGAGANTALSNLAAVAINTSLISDANDTDDLGSDALRWRDLYLGPGTLHIGTATGDEGSVSYNTTTNALGIDSTGALDLLGGSGSTGCSVSTAGGVTCSGSSSFVNGTFTGAVDVQSVLRNTAGVNLEIDEANIRGTAALNITTQSGAVSLTPTAGSNVNVVLSTTGDFVVNTDDLYVDTSAGSVGIGDTSPDALLDVAGSFQFDGDATFGDAATDNVVFTADVNSNILPNTDDTFTLGDADQRWADVFVGPASIHIGTSATDEGTVNYNTTSNILEFSTDSTTNADIAFFTDDLYIDKSSGFVGIGDATPSAMLSVGSTSQFQIDASGNVTTTGTFEAAGIEFSGDLLPSAAPSASEEALITTVLDSTNQVGEYTSIVIGDDNLPIIAFRDLSVADLVVIHCGNADCTSGNTRNIANNGNAVGQYNSMAIGDDGFPVISYYQTAAGGSNFLVTKCGNADCSSGNTSTTVDSTGDVGAYTALAVGTDGFPVVAYEDDDAADVNVVKCGDAGCTTGNTITSVDTVGVPVGTSIAIGTDDFPIISYGRAGSSLVVTHCGDDGCTTGNTITTIETTGIVSTSIVIGSDGLPVVSYVDSTNSVLKVLHCGNIDCTANNEILTLDTLVGAETSITIGADGRPIITYYNSTNDNLEVVKCGNLNCSSGNAFTTLDQVGDVGQFSDVAIGTDDLPIVSYHLVTSQDLKVTKCNNPSCSSSGLDTYTGGADIGSPAAFFNNVYANTFWGKNFQIEGFDLAETYRVHDASIEAGDIVRISSNQEGNGPFVEKTAGASDPGAIGVVSTKPGLALTEWKADATSRPIGLAGRVPTKVNAENGPIAVGDAITTSSVSGVGMKATEAGPIVGYALEAFDGSGQGSVVVFLKAGYYAGTGSAPTAGSNNQASGFGSGGTADFTALNMSGNIYMAGNDIIDVEKISGLGGVWSVDATGKFTTAGSYDVVIKSYQDEDVVTHAVLGREHKVTLDGTAELVNGTATVTFEQVDPSFNDIISTGANIRVSVTPNGPASLYVAAKDHNGFTVQQLGGSDSGISFDWFVSAYRKDFEPEVVEAIEVIEEPPVVEEPPAEAVSEESPAEEVSVEETPPAEEPVIEEPPIEETPTEEPAPPVSPEPPPVDPAPAQEEPSS